jgi:REP element-mobilizing transposase RayT
MKAVCSIIAKMQMLDDREFEIYEENEFPLAYLLTFRTFGTWLHGDGRESVGRDGRNHYGKPRIRPNSEFEAAMKEEAKQHPFILTKPMRGIVEAAIKELCERRSYRLQAVNVRTNHAHAVVSAQMRPERMADALKANATKMLRESLLISSDTKVWSRGRSRRYLWKPGHVGAAIDYVLYCQSDVPFDLVD